MSEPQVVYSVTGADMGMLSTIAQKGELTTDEGWGRFLQTICPQVWPEIRLRIEEYPNADGYAGGRVKVVALREFRFILWSEKPNDIWVLHVQPWTVDKPVPYGKRVTVHWAVSQDEAVEKIRQHCTPHEVRVHETPT